MEIAKLLSACQEQELCYIHAEKGTVNDIKA
jgi:hypothetical protein